MRKNFESCKPSFSNQTPFLLAVFLVVGSFGTPKSVWGQTVPPRQISKTKVSLVAFQEPVESRRPQEEIPTIEKLPSAKKVTEETQQPRPIGELDARPHGEPIVSEWTVDDGDIDDRVVDDRVVDPWSGENSQGDRWIESTSMEPEWMGSLGCDGLPSLECYCGAATMVCPWQLKNLIDPRRYELLVGSQAFQGAMNQLPAPSGLSTGGSFGFHEGIQFSSPMPWLFQGWLTGQAGFRAVQSHLQSAAPTDVSRNQAFLTLGAFRRVDFGLQGGLAIDCLEDRWYYQASLTQLRGELSFVGKRGDLIGFRFASHVQSDVVTESIPSVGQWTSTLSALDAYRFFYQFRPNNGQSTWLTLAAGFTEDRDGLVEAAVETALTSSIGLRSNALYVRSSTDGQDVDAWSMGLSIVVTPGRRFGAGWRYDQALLPVADNSSFLIRRRP